MLLPSKHIRMFLVLQTVQNIGTRCPRTRQTVLRMYNVHITIVLGAPPSIDYTGFANAFTTSSLVHGNFIIKHYHKSRYIPRKPVSRRASESPAHTRVSDTHRRGTMCSGLGLQPPSCFFFHIN